MSTSPEEAYVVEAAAAAGLALEGDSLKAVVANTRILRQLQAQFADIPLPDDLDPAGVLRL